MRRSKMAVAAVALAALLAGCGSDDDDAGNGPQGTTATTTATSGLMGEYRRTLTAADIERTDDVRQEAGPTQERPEPGPLALDLRDGTLEFVDLGAKLTVLQDFSATSDGALRIGAYQRPEEGSFCGPDIAQTAAYTWKLAGDVLTLKAKQDRCADRDSALSGDWKRR
ncbi:MAG: hypothetical protein H0T69_01090 [Thermoleophilaceae bacterium]|nr:hypothetical protein [Thermoleophilaceae bacterium]